MRLKKLLESSVRDRLKKRAKNVDIEGSKAKNLAPYLKRVTRLHKLNPSTLEQRYIGFYSKCVLRTPSQRSDYLVEAVLLLGVINVDGNYTHFNFPHNQDQVIDKVGERLKKLLKSMDIPEEFDLKTVAILLRFLEEHDFKLEGV